MSVPLRVMAQAWLDGQDKKEAERSVTELSTLVLASRQANVRQTLYSPLIATKTKKATLAHAGFTDAVVAIIGWIDRNALWKKLPNFVWHTQNLLESKAVSRQAKVWSAIALTAKEKTSLLTRLKKRFEQEVTIHAEVAPEILGGLVIDFAGVRVDASVRGKLTRIKESLQAANV